MVFRKYRKFARRPPRRLPRRKTGLRFRRRPRFYKRRQPRRMGLSMIKVKCNGQVQPFGRYRSMTPYWKSKLERLYFSASRNTYQSLSGFQICNWNAGKQGVGSQTIWSNQDITNALNSVSLAPTTSGNVRNTSRSYLQKCYAEFNFTNSCNYPIEFAIYIYKQKRDSEDSIQTLWDSGIQDMTGTGVPTTTSTTYGQTPFENPAISTYLRCVKVLHYNVMAGQTFKYTHESNLYRLFNNELIQLDLQADSYLRGITDTILFIAKGAPAQLTTGGNVIGVGGGQVSCVVTKKFQFKYIQDVNWNTNDLAANLPSAAVNVLNPTGYATAAQVMQGAGI